MQFGYQKIKMPGNILEFKNDTSTIFYFFYILEESENVVFHCQRKF